MAHPAEAMAQSVKSTPWGAVRAPFDAARVAACGLWSVTLIGLGNIGGFAAGLLARLHGLGRLTLIDFDIYDESNVRSQDIDAADVGKPKAVVTAQRLRRINPRLQVEALVGDVASVPLGVLRSDLLVACVDSRRARLSINQAAWRLGSPWADAGVRADGNLARVNVYLPAADQPCFECAFDASDYAAIGQTYPCLGDAAAPAATNASASLGALAAALQVLEIEKLLGAHWQHALIGKQVVVDAAAHRHVVTGFRHNPACRFDHATWDILTLDEPPSALRISAAVKLALPTGDASSAALRVEGQAFVRQLTCPSCGETEELGWRLSGRLGTAQQCAACRRRMLATGFDVSEWLREGDLPLELREAPLSSLGLCAGDVLTVRAAAGERHVQLGHVPAAPDSAAAGDSERGETE